MKPKSINSLMAYMRDCKGIKIEGSIQKKKLRYMGYFHGYKGYRYFNTPNTLLKYQNFNEIQAVYNFDMQLKSIMYSKIMFFETTIKNYALEVILKEAGSKRFADIYVNLLNDYQSYPIGTKQYKQAMSKRMAVRNKVYNVISRDYEKNNIVRHYYDKDQPMPIWAIFELLSLGEFGNFLSCLNSNVRKNISKSAGIKSSFDNDGRLIEKIIYAIKDLRNAVAHNGIIFDTRFNTGKINSHISNYILSETEIMDVNFKTIVDYVILISFVLKLLECNKNEIISFIKQFEDACENLRKLVPMNIYSKIVYTDTKGKLKALRSFL